MEHGTNTGSIQVDLMDMAVGGEWGKKSLMHGDHCLNCCKSMSNFGLNYQATVYGFVCFLILILHFEDTVN